MSFIDRFDSDASLDAKPMPEQRTDLISAVIVGQFDRPLDVQALFDCLSQLRLTRRWRVNRRQLRTQQGDANRPSVRVTVHIGSRRYAFWNTGRTTVTGTLDIDATYSTLTELIALAYADRRRRETPKLRQEDLSLTEISVLVRLPRRINIDALRRANGCCASNTIGAGDWRATPRFSIEICCALFPLDTSEEYFYIDSNSEPIAPSTRPSSNSARVLIDLFERGFCLISGMQTLAHYAQVRRRLYNYLVNGFLKDAPTKHAMPRVGSVEAPYESTRMRIDACCGKAEFTDATVGTDTTFRDDASNDSSCGWTDARE